MNRRDAVSRVALLLGSAIIGTQTFLSGCKNSGSKDSSGPFSEDNIAFLDEVGETILPATASSPGAKEAKIGEYMKIIVTDCYEEKDQKVFFTAIDKINETARKKHAKGFLELDGTQKHDLLVDLDKEATTYNKNKKKDDPSHYFSKIKQLTLSGFFSSEVGATRALRYVAVPGRYDGCIAYNKGDKAWA